MGRGRQRSHIGRPRPSRRALRALLRMRAEQAVHCVEALKEQTMTHRLAAICLGLALASPAAAADLLKIASPQRGSWEGAIPELGQQQGIFRKHGIDLDILYTAGGGETLQAV